MQQHVHFRVALVVIRRIRVISIIAVVVVFVIIVVATGNNNNNNNNNSHHDICFNFLIVLALGTYAPEGIK